MRHALLAFLAVALYPGLCGADAYPRQRGLDVLHYQFKISLSDATDEIEGEAKVLVRFASDGVEALRLDLASPSKSGGMKVAEVGVAGAPAGFTHRGDVLTIALDPPPKAGERREVVLKYRGKPAGGLRSEKDRAGERVVFAENWPDKAHQWLPVVDHPHDKATNELLVSAPARYQVIGNGKPGEPVDLADGRRLTRWSQSVPIPAWQFVVVMGRFEPTPTASGAGIPMRFWAYAEDRDRARGPAEVMRQAALFFADYVGPYPYEKLDAVGLGIGFSGLENASLIYFSDREIFGPDRSRLVAHEVAHQWFGDSVTEADWDDAWLSEGFATYFSILFQEHCGGTPALREGLARSRKLVLDALVRAPGGKVIHENPEDLGQVIEPIVYHKGAWTLHMLRGLVGPGPFREGIRAYYRDHRDGNASTDDFRLAMESAAKVELSWFFNQWLRRPGIPSVVGEWSYDPDAKEVIVDLTQVQPGEAYRLPIEVGVAEAGAGGPRVEGSEMKGKQLRIKVRSESVPSAVTLDPNGWLLMRSRFVPRRTDGPAPPH